MSLSVKTWSQRTFTCPLPPVCYFTHLEPFTRARLYSAFSLANLSSVSLIHRSSFAKSIRIEGKVFLPQQQKRKLDKKFTAMKLHSPSEPVILALRC